MVPHSTRAVTVPIVEVAKAFTDTPEIVSDSEEGGGSGDEDDGIRGIPGVSIQLSGFSDGHFIDTPVVSSGIQVGITFDSLEARC